MNNSIKYILLCSLLIATVTFGVARNPFNTDDPTIVVDYMTVSDSIPYEVPLMFVALQEPHISDRDGVFLYLTYLRGYMNGFLNFDDLTQVLEHTLTTYGLISLIMEDGMFSRYEVGFLSRFQIISQFNRDQTYAAIYMMDLKGSAPYKLVEIFRGPVHFITLCDTYRHLIIRTLDRNEYRLCWSDIGVY